MVPGTEVAAVPNSPKRFFSDGFAVKSRTAPPTMANLTESGILSSSTLEFDARVLHVRPAAMRAPIFALCFMSSTFALRDSPPVSSLMRFNRKGVTSPPRMLLSTASCTAFFVASSIGATSAASSAGMGLPMTMPDFMAKSLWELTIAATSDSVSHTVGTGSPEDGVKKAGKVLVLKPITETPCVSKYSRVLGKSRIDFAPAHTTATGVRPNSVRSAETSHVASAPL
mmetsp:Transcript_11870/g.19494  ORF Transcript_11870/g.19494 Transcript_11870/m.19494 type:complete len:227 (+) Transcript_11870:311-991(+)